MSLIGALVGYALTAFNLLVLARMVLDWSGVLANDPQWTSQARELTRAWAEPVIGRMLRPVRVGGMSIDLAFTGAFIAALILHSIAFSLQRQHLVPSVSRTALNSHQCAAITEHYSRSGSPVDALSARRGTQS